MEPESLSDRPCLAPFTVKLQKDRNSMFYKGDAKSFLIIYTSKRKHGFEKSQTNEHWKICQILKSNYSNESTMYVATHKNMVVEFLSQIELSRATV